MNLDHRQSRPGPHNHADGIRVMYDEVVSVCTVDECQPFTEVWPIKLADPDAPYMGAAVCAFHDSPKGRRAALTQGERDRLAAEAAS